MRLGTRSLLFGVHQVFVHPWFVALAWWKLYGWPCDYRLWVAFFVHDLGYWKKLNMDGSEGEQHPELGAAIMRRLYGDEWGDFTLLHSRHYARTLGRNFSQLCVADKLASVLYPEWFYILLARLSGEMQEYRRGGGDRFSLKWKELNAGAETDRDWFRAFKEFMTDWINQSKDLGDPIPDTKVRVDS